MPDPLVLDASAWLAVILQEEAGDALEARLAHHRLLAPEWIRLEVANGILVALRRKRLKIKKFDFSAVLQAVQEFPLSTVPLEVWWMRAVRLCQAHDLTFYDAAYLALAVELKLPLLTLDKRLVKAAAAEQIAVLP